MKLEHMKTSERSWKLCSENVKRHEPYLDIVRGERRGSVSSGPNSATLVVDTQWSNEIYYNMCSQLNKERLLFDLIMHQSVTPQFAEDNNTAPIEPYHLFLSGGGV